MIDNIAYQRRVTSTESKKFLETDNFSNIWE